MGKGVEILLFMADNEPCKEYALRKKKQWSSKTVWSQLNKFKHDGLIRNTEEGYVLTDFGFSALISHLDDNRGKRIFDKAQSKYPRGETEGRYGYWFSRPSGRMVNIRNEIDRNLRRPNVFVLCRTDDRGNLVWSRVIPEAFNARTGHFSLRVSKRIQGIWRRIDLSR